jgi:hypothetical protein
MAPVALRQIEDDTTRRALDLIRGLGAVVAQLRDDGTKCTDQIECDLISDQHEMFS